ncbi:transglycosylase domain-containing protein [Aneurinibacillus sp. Ricciae_BoGa-3]|uniref:transglycosylase domain-containing protein n=1 Tax=Aneurinibacillus sp. Ricciae_BoGa-3 TaxID=3022697 RepID=UPI00233FEF1A|nr:transglycosylase domain-containing protein [Aneurinibacillus sp. Ricciae_BoGa-3]WCK56482.1 transglycosylase domain-containing protein [Aneurinibacillus sp. Ricciae_BoGa-3]
MKILKNLVLLIFVVGLLWESFLLTFSTVYPIAAQVRQAAATKIHARHSSYMKYGDIPGLYKQATIATEDRRFYEHFGIDIMGVGRSLFTDIQNRQPTEGGSTITQQLIRNTVLTQERTLSRKVKEMILAIALERFMSKQEILELYLNVIYFGHGAFGVEQASLVYFGKPVTSLSLAEISLLAGLPQAPTVYDPYKAMGLAKQRQQQVLSNLVQSHYITPEEAKQAANTPIRLANNKGL